jgi:nucleotide-binding universal stress UspA family protein
MKTILAPTDFSPTAKIAINYAVEIAKHAKAKLILFHVFPVPFVPAEAPITPPVDEIEKECMEDLKSIEKKLRMKHGDSITIECACSCGFPVEEINRYAEENEIDLIVMGMEGAGYLTEKMIGSITTSLIKKAKRPVLAIDKHIKFRAINKIALACDNAEAKDKSILDPLKELALLFKSHIYVVNVVPESEVIASVDKSFSNFIKVNGLLKGIDHSFHFTSNDDVVDGINNFIDDQKIDLIVIIPRVHSILKQLFHPPVSKHMVFHTKVPLLALHE